MKKFIIVIVLILLTLQHSQAQQPEHELATVVFGNKPGTIDHINEMPLRTNAVSFNGPGYEHYKKKRQKNLTVGVLTLSAGLLFSGIGLIADSNYDKDNTSAYLFIAGAVSGIVSIPFMIMATINGHKAKLELKNQQTGFGVPANVDNQIPGITMSIHIGK
ncbi:MAG: hypothetical protein KF825_09215 [Ferruginibacter sp.]|nr:hypothetical protein [Ferruginibacter sp.]